MLRVICVSTLLLLGVLVNVKVLYVILAQPERKRKRPASILNAHLSCVAVFYAILVSAQFADQRNIISLQSPGVCEAVSVFERLFKGLFALNVFAIVFERFQTFNCFNRGKLLWKRLICLVWSIAVIFALPSALMQKSVLHNPGKKSTETLCQPVHLLDSVAATVIFEAFYLIVFHFLVVLYMIYAMYKIKARPAQLYINKPIPDHQTQRRVIKIRFIFVHFISLLFFWIPFGILLFVLKILQTTNFSRENPYSVMEKIFGVIIYIYMVLNGLIYLWLMSSKRIPVDVSSRNSSSSPNTAQIPEQPSNEAEAGSRILNDLSCKAMPQNSMPQTRNLPVCVHSPVATTALQETVGQFKVTRV